MVSNKLIDPLELPSSLSSQQQQNTSSSSRDNNQKRRTIIRYSLYAFIFSLFIAFCSVLIIYFTTDIFTITKSGNNNKISSRSSSSVLDSNANSNPGEEGCCSWGGWDICLAWTRSTKSYCQTNQTVCDLCNGHWIANKK
mmetsp:Transcript_18107/g.20884  ORF Transcript_18107/g.20884 Transcript_18107/m.20884 type:complete len:140 (+) Transcript_18107:202-621(+)